MKVFLSWSGERSKQAALFLSKWLPHVIQALRPWMSHKDIEAGKRWDSELAKQLEEADFGIICLTPENQHAPWIMFEAGALAKHVEDAHVAPYLIGMATPADMAASPLSTFQVKVASDKESTRALVQTLNRALKDRALAEETLEHAFETNWEELETFLQELRPPKDVPKPPDTSEMVREILATVRGLSKSQSELLREGGLFGGLSSVHVGTSTLGDAGETPDEDLELALDEDPEGAPDEGSK